MRRYIFTFLLCIGFGNNTFSQDLSTQEAIKNINKIKMDSKYLYAESTTKDWEEAYENAKTVLGVTISEWVKENSGINKDVELLVAKSKDHILSIKTRRGELYRSFVYVKKSDIIPIADERELMIVKMEKEPEEPIAMVPVSEKVEPPKDEDNSSEELVTVVDLKTHDPEPVLIATLSKEEEQMLQIHSLDEAEIFVNRLKSDNKMKGYGKYKTMPVNENCYLIVYNPQGEIPAVLKKDGNNHFNLNTRQADSISKYEGCGAIWIQLK